MALDDKDHFAQIEKKIDDLADKVEAVADDVRWYNAACRLLVGAVTFIGMFALAFGTGYIRDQARQVFNEQAKAGQQLSQTGTWSEKNRIDLNTFEWKLSTPVDARSVASVESHALSPLPGIFTTAAIGSDGATCVMKLDGAPEALSAITYPVEAVVTIRIRK